MTDQQFIPGDPNGAGIRAASEIATAVRSRPIRRPIVAIGIALLGLTAVTIAVLAVVANLNR